MSSLVNSAFVTVVGAGLAGSECALQLAERGVKVKLFEMRPQATTAAHHTEGFAELVCSNSLKSQRLDSAAGLLKGELSLMGSKLLQFARQSSVPAGGALAVDRKLFSRLVTDAVSSHPLIEVVHDEVRAIPEGPCVIAAGPLCSDTLFEDIMSHVGNDAASFFDAAAPIVDASTLNRELVFSQSRYDEGGAGDYLNCTMNKEEYTAFYEALINARRVIQKEFEQADLFQACQPVEEVARTGRDSLRFGALKPVGLTDPRTGKRPWACVQLRAEDAHGSAYNLVGFQTNLVWSAQKEVFRMIPGLEHAEFFRYGVMHRNSFIDSPHVLDETFAIPGTQVRFAGQICGTEGYTEAIASGMFAALNTYAALVGAPNYKLPDTSAFGSLVAYATNPETKNYQPMHVNFGIVPPIEPRPKNKKERYRAFSRRALGDVQKMVASRPDLFENGAAALDMSELTEGSNIHE